MVDDRLEDQGPAPEPARPKRTPPTIELAATEVPGETEAASEAQVESQSETEQPGAAEAPPTPPPASSTISPWVVAPFSGAVAASLVILVGWMLGWPQVLPASSVPEPKAAAIEAAAIDDLAARVASLEAKTSKPASDPAVTARIDAIEKSAAALRAQSDKLAAAVNEMKSAPGDTSATSPGLSAISERIGQIERAVRAADEKAAEAAKPSDDKLLRRLVAAALLDVAVRHGDPYAAALNAAKSLAPDPDALKPLEIFADKGVPNPPALTRELLTLVPKLSPSAEGSATTGTGIIDRLQAGATKLVRIQRTDATGNDRAAVVARVTAAALRNDFAEARRELSSLSPADRAPAQAWLDKAAARDAALAASRQFAEESMAALAKSAQ